MWPLPRICLLLSGAPKDCFLQNICSEKQILPGSSYYLNTAKDFQISVPFMYNVRKKIPYDFLKAAQFIKFLRYFVNCSVVSKIFRKITLKPLSFRKTSSFPKMTEQIQIYSAAQNSFPEMSKSSLDSLIFLKKTFKCIQEKTSLGVPDLKQP